MSEEILKLLGGLGSTPQDIAVSLGAARIKAQKGSPSFHNPIVRYLYLHLNVGGLIYVPVHNKGLLTVVRPGKTLTVQLPGPVALFLDAFHAGTFPLLEE